MDILEKINGVLFEVAVDLFDDVKNKKSGKTFKVVEIETGTVRLSPVGEKNPKEFDVARKTFDKEYVAA